jgi:hypothetical protein
LKIYFFENEYQAKTAIVCCLFQIILMIIVKTAFRHLYPDPSSFRGLLDFSLTSLNKIIDNMTLDNDL